MFCCAGLFGGFVLGAATGIPWMPLVAAGIGAGGGILTDITILRALDERKEKNAKSQPINRAMACCNSPISKKKQKSEDLELPAD